MSKRNRFKHEKTKISEHHQVIIYETPLSLFCLKTLEYLWLSLIILIPLAYDVGYDAHLIKFYVLGIIVSIMFVLFAIRLIEIKRIDLKFNKFSKIMLGVFTSIVLAVVFSKVPEYSFWGSERLQGFVSITMYFLLFVIIAGSLRKQSQVNNIFTAIAWSGIINGFIAILHHYNSFIIPQFSENMISPGLFRSEGLTGNPMFLGGFLALTLPFVFYKLFLSYKSHHYSMYIYGFGLLINLYGLYATSTRGAFLAVFAGLVVYLIVVGIINRKKWLWIGAVAMTVLALSVIVSLNMNSNPLHIPKNGVTARFSNLLGNEGYSSLKSRVLIWEGVLKPINDHLWFGLGPDAAGPVLQRTAYFDKDLFSQEIDIYQKTIDRAHNIILDSMLSFGLFGTLLFFVLIIYVFTKMIKEISNKALSDEEKYMFLALIITGIVVLVYGLSAFYEIITYVYIFLLLGVIYFLIERKKYNELIEKVKNNPDIPMRILVCYFLAGILAVFMFICFIHPILGNQIIINNASKKFMSGNFKEAKTDIVDLRTNYPWNFYAIQLLSNILQKIENIDELIELEKDFSSFVKDAPDNIYARIIIGNIYNKLGHATKDNSYHEKASYTLDDALLYFGDRYQIYSFYIYNFASVGDFAGANQKLKEAFLYSEKLKGQDLISAAKGANFYNTNYQDNGNVEAFNYLSQMVNIPDTKKYIEKFKLLNLFHTERNDTEGVIANWKECIKVLPGNIDCVGELSVVYAKLNDFEKALFYADEMIKIDSKKGNEVKAAIEKNKAKQGQ